jgi:predicted Zn finger-like uncharacterized protein
MIVTCPACRTRYLVPEPELAQPGGRTVRCATCGHSWRQEPAAAERPPPEPHATLVPPPPEPVPEIIPAPAPDPPIAPVAPRRRHPGIAFGSLAVLVLIVLAILALVVGRFWVAAAWPPAGRLFAAIGLPAETPGSGLKIDKIAPSRAADGLVIEGEIVNASVRPVQVPRLRVALQDGAGKEVQFKIIDPPKALLQPGEAAHFRTPFEHASDAATGVVVTFAPG